MTQIYKNFKIVFTCFIIVTSTSVWNAWTAYERGQELREMRAEYETYHVKSLETLDMLKQERVRYDELQFWCREKGVGQ